MEASTPSTETNSDQQQSELRREVSLTVAWDQIAAAAIDKLKELQKTRALRGFRAGKTPMAMMLRHFGASIQEDCAREQLQEVFDAHLKSEGLELVGILSVQAESCVWQGDSVFKLEFEVMPSYHLYEFEDVPRLADPIEDPEASATPELLNQALMKFRLTNSRDLMEKLPEGSQLQLWDLVRLQLWRKVTKPEPQDEQENEAGAAEAESASAESEPGAVSADQEPIEAEWRTMGGTRDHLLGWSEDDFAQGYPLIVQKLLELKVESNQEFNIVGDTNDPYSDHGDYKIDILRAFRVPGLTAPDDAYVTSLGWAGVTSVAAARDFIARQRLAAAELEWHRERKVAYTGSLSYHYRFELPPLLVANAARRLRAETIENLVREQGLKMAHAEQRADQYSFMHTFRAETNVRLSLLGERYMKHYADQLPEISDAEVDATIKMQLDSYISAEDLAVSSLGEAQEFYSQMLEQEDFRNSVRIILKERALIDLFWQRSREKVKQPNSNPDSAPVKSEDSAPAE